jgi:hypothetical protein
VKSRKDPENLHKGKDEPQEDDLYVFNHYCALILGACLDLYRPEPLNLAHGGNEEKAEY